MKKLIAVLVSALFATAAFAQAPAPQKAPAQPEVKAEKAEVKAEKAEAKAEKDRPTLIIGNTVMGRGALAADCTSFECQVSTHGQPLSAAGADFAQTVKNLGGDPENPFVIFPEAQELYDKRI